MKRLQHVMNSLIRFSQVLLLFFLVVVVCQTFRSFPEAEFLVGHASGIVTGCLLVVMTTLLALFFYVVYQGLKRLSKRAHVMIRGALVLVALALQIVFLCYYRSLYMWDSAFVVGGASSLLKDGRIAEEAIYYFGQYPNQNMFAVITKMILAVANFAGVQEINQMLVLNAVNMLCIDVALALTLFLVKELKPNISQHAYTMAWIVIFCQPIWYMGVSYYYTITLAMPFFMGFIYGSFRCLDEIEKSELDMKKMLLWGSLSGVVLSVGILIRATCIVPAVAFLIYGIVRIIMNRSKIKTAIIGIAIWCGVALCATLILKPVINNQIGLDTTDTAFPATHWIMMSMTSPGSHNGEDEAFTASYSTASEKREAVKMRMQEKAAALGASGMVSLALEKIRNTWSNGTNNYVLFMENCLHMDGMYPYVFGHHKDVAVLFHQAMLLLTVIGGILSCIYGILAKTVDTKVYVIRLIWLGGFMFYLMWETGGQYSLPFLACMILCSLDGFAAFGESARVSGRVKQTGLIGVSAGMFLCMAGCLIKLYPDFTQEMINYKSPVVNQLIADGQISVSASLEQTFQTNDAFNQVVFQWRNFKGAENQAVYELALLDEVGQCLRQEKIEASGQVTQGAAIWDLEMQTPDRVQRYTIQVKKMDASGDTLEFVTYSCGSYHPYPNGILSVDGTQQACALMFQVSRNEMRTYTTSKKYVFFALMVACIFLILEICCILDWYGKSRLIMDDQE